MFFLKQIITNHPTGSYVAGGWDSRCDLQMISPSNQQNDKKTKDAYRIPKHNQICCPQSIKQRSNKNFQPSTVTLSLFIYVNGGIDPAHPR